MNTFLQRIQITLVFVTLAIIVGSIIGLDYQSLLFSPITVCFLLVLGNYCDLPYIVTMILYVIPIIFYPINNVCTVPESNIVDPQGEAMFAFCSELHDVKRLYLAVLILAHGSLSPILISLYIKFYYVFMFNPLLTGFIIYYKIRFTDINWFFLFSKHVPCVKPVFTTPFYKENDFESKWYIPHCRERNVRNYVTQLLTYYISKAGLIRYDWSPSTREAGCDGERLVYNDVKDLKNGLKIDDIKPNHVLTLVDVDYYPTIAELEDKILKFNRIIIYSFDPVLLSGRTPNGVWTSSVNNIHYDIEGAKRYEHGLKVYPFESLTIQSWFYSHYYTVVQYRSPLDAVHSFVILEKSSVFFNPFGWFTTHITNRVNHKVVTDQLTVIYQRILEKGEFYINIALEYSPAQIVLKQSEYDRIRVSLSKLDGKYYESGIASKLQCFGFAREEANIIASFLVNVPLESIQNYYSSKVENTKRNYSLACHSFKILKDGENDIPPNPDPIATIGRTKEQVVDDEVNYATPDQKGVPLMTKVLDNITPPAVSPVRSLQMDAITVDNRLTKVRNVTELSEEYINYSDEFSKLVVGNNKVVPYTISEVMKKYSNPAQQKRYANSQKGDYAFDAYIKSFQKAEVYNKISAPRNISTLPTEHLIELSKFTYPFKNVVLKKLHWYAPGSTPVEIATKVYDLRKSHKYLMGTDFSRFDGTISKGLRTHVEKKVYELAFPNSKVGQLIDNEIHAVGRTAYGIRYVAGGTRLSGSPLTTDGNTLINCFVAYCAYRKIGLAPNIAYKSLGIYYGDDGLQGYSSDIISKKTILVAKELGLKLKEESFRLGQPVAFLGRFYYNNNSRSSCQDVVRTIPRLFVVEGRKLKEKECYQRLANRVAGYLVTDYHTPIVADLCHYALRCCEAKGIDIGNVKPDQRYNLINCSESSTYPYESDFSEEMDYVASSLKISVEEVLSLCRAIASTPAGEPLPRIVTDPLKIEISASLAGRPLGA